jgi:hypothetical protein
MFFSIFSKKFRKNIKVPITQRCKRNFFENPCFYAENVQKITIFDEKWEIW